MSFSIFFVFALDVPWKVLKLVHHPDPRGSEGENSTSGGGGGGSSRNSSSSKKKKVAAPIWVKKNCFQNYKVAVAAVLHDEWRKPRLLPDGTYDPRPKEVRAVSSSPFCVSKSTPFLLPFECMYVRAS